MTHILANNSKNGKLRLDENSNLKTSVINISGSVSLPTGASTEATLGSLNDKVTACDTGAVVISSGSISLPTGASTEATLSSLNDKVTACDTGAVVISSGSISLPTGASTEATLSSLNGKVTACDTGAVVISSGSISLPTGASTEATLSSLNGKVTACDTGAVVISSGSISLPTGASTEATLSSLNGKVTACDTGAVVISSGSISLPTGASTEATLGSLNGKVTACNTGAVVISSGSLSAVQSGTWNINNVSGTISLPTGASTEATLDSLNNKVTACDTGAVVISSGAITETNSGAVKASLANMESQLPSALDGDRFKTRNTFLWHSSTPMSEETITAGSTTTSTVVDLTDKSGEGVHFYLACAPVGVTNLNITIEHSPDNTNWFADLDSIVVEDDSYYQLLDTMSRYFRLAVTNNDSESSVVTLIIACHA
jgi:hypothetical protein